MLFACSEFTMAEIEHFVDPADKTHPKFASVADYEVTLFSACNQMDGRPAERHAIGAAVAKKMIANETLAYFMARVHSYMVRVGVDVRKLRFRQHLANEMAHYAADCWDAECLTSYVSPPVPVVATTICRAGLSVWAWRTAHATT